MWITFSVAKKKPKETFETVGTNIPVEHGLLVTYPINIWNNETDTRGFNVEVLRNCTSDKWRPIYGLQWLRRAFMYARLCATAGVEQSRIIADQFQARSRLRFNAGAPIKCGILQERWQRRAAGWALYPAVKSAWQTGPWTEYSSWICETKGLTEEPVRHRL